MKKYAIIIFVMACFGISSKEVKANTIHKKQVGIASWYGGKFIGRKTASGEIFSSRKFTCAHKTLPLGTTLKVHSLDTNKEIIVVVNDRGPYVKGRVVDLSPIAANALGFGKKGNGLSNVSITPISIPTEYAEYHERNKRNKKRSK